MRKPGYEYYIFTSDYDGKNKKYITSGKIRINVLGVFGELLYFMNNDRSSVKEMNTSNEIVGHPRNIAVERNYYYDLIVVHSNLERIGEL